MSEAESAEDDLVARFGLHPAKAKLDGIRAILAAESARGWDADVAAMKVCCVQLFNAGDFTDVLRIWAAKMTNFDSSCSIDVQLLCGRGLSETKKYLAGLDSEDAREALSYLLECEAAHDFDQFSVDAWSASWRAYYSPRSDES